MNSDLRSALIAGLTPLDLLSRTIRQTRVDERERPHKERRRWLRRSIDLSATKRQQ